MHILLVEDHAPLARASAMALREYGHDVHVADSAAAALAAASGERFDIALIDINLPEEDGYRLATSLRSLPSMKNAVLVALTGIGLDIDRERAAASGFDATYSKPMNFDLLPQIKRGEMDGAFGHTC